MSDHFRAKRRTVLRWAMLAGTSLVGSACEGGSWLASPPLRRSPGIRIALDPIEGGRVVTDVHAKPARLFESPVLAELVREGKLPPVAERVGRDPLVIRPLREVGRYGGSIRRAFTGNVDYENANRFASGPDRLLYWDAEFRTVTPWLAAAFELSTDARSLHLRLRSGMRWSDGMPFTADDIVFWYEDIYGNQELTPFPHANMQINGKAVRAVKVDALTVAFVSPDPNPMLPELLASYSILGGQAGFGGRLGQGGFAPKHYLSSYLPGYAGQAAVDRLAREAGARDWIALFRERAEWTQNAELPVVTPWKVRKGNELRTLRWVFERNPYAIWIDTAGNQLPYIDRIDCVAMPDSEDMGRRILVGGLDFQDRRIEIKQIPDLVAGEARGGYKVHISPALGNGFGLRVNLAYDVDREVGDLLRVADFRRALSLGIDRDELNDRFFLGLATTGSYAPPAGNRYYPGPEVDARWARHDVTLANQLLDRLGYAERDKDGFRLRKDGQGRVKLQCRSTASFADFGAITAEIAKQWRGIGIELDARAIASDDLTERALLNGLQLSGHTVGSEDLFLLPDVAFPYVTNNYPAMLGRPYAQWFHSNGAAGTEPFPDLKELMQLWRRGYAAPTERERIAIGKQWWLRAADLCLQIGIVKGDLVNYGAYIANEKLMNVPRRVVNALPPTNLLNALPFTFFYRE
jgi:peptide/nickel transport system substrate-binding protein